MLIKGNIKGRVYQQLMKYAYEKCDTISLSKYSNQHLEEYNKIINIILSESKNLVDEITGNLSIKSTNEIYERFKNNSNIFDEEYIKRYEANTYGFDSAFFEKFKIDNRRNTIVSSINWLSYDNSTSRCINIHKNDIIFEKKEKINNEQPYRTVYFFQISEEIKEMVLNNKTLFSWCFPNYLDNISFFKKGYCWLYSVAHEELCEIYCGNKEEYEYLKSIGIEFVDKEFKSTPKEKLYYEKY